jgi:energy-coupling factor transporter ATP-binding protein EcfA2
MGPAAQVVHATAKASHGIDWGAILARAGVGLGVVASIATIIAIVPMTRNGFLRARRALLMGIGIPYRRYTRKFTERYRSYQNPYLDRHENLDLRSTYVPLSFQVGDAQDLALASDVLARLSGSRVIIVGDPGSGKSTLLKAYGVGALQGRHILPHRRRVVPYLVQLRVLARFLVANKGIADFIVDEVLVKGGVFWPGDAKEFFRRTLARRQAVVLLDGLDEVPDELQPAVLAAVLAFTRDETLDRPTARAAVLLTCRTQNFRSLRDNWVPVFARADQQYALAPFRDSEIMNYLRRFPDKFRAADGPARFMKAARDAKTLDLMRAPLVLAMAVGSYGYRPAELPSTIAELYESMIKEMLDRNSFRREDPEHSVLRFRVSDKYRFLRQFALRAVEHTGEFSEFTRLSLVDYAASLTDKLGAVDDPAALVKEVIQRSSLLSNVGDDDGEHELFLFAHRSIQEFLTAQELRMPGRDGDTLLLDRAGDLTWRQTILFYTAGQEAESVDQFLCELARRDSDLAAYCLQGAMPSDGAAAEVLDALNPVTGAKLGALATATRSPRQRVQQMAVDQLKAFITDSVDELSASEATIEGMMPLLESLAGTNAGDIAALVPQIIRNLPDDPRLVGPLWQCLSGSGIELRKSQCAEIVRRLLTLAMEPNAFAELDRQDAHDRAFLRPLRAQAYPFKSALPREHNLVTLLAWSEYLGITPVNCNRFFATKAAGRLTRIERDRRYTVSFPIRSAGQVTSSLIIATALIFAIIVGITGAPPKDTLDSIVILVLPVFAVAPCWYFLRSIQRGSGACRGNIIFQLTAPNELQPTWPPARQSALIFQIFISTFAITLALKPLIAVNLADYILATIGAQALFWSTCLNYFDSARRFYPYRRSEYVDVYDDPQSRHWLVS